MGRIVFNLFKDDVPKVGERHLASDPAERSAQHQGRFFSPTRRTSVPSLLPPTDR